MAAGTTPIFPITPNSSLNVITAAEAVTDGTSANDVAVFTAGVNGSRVYKMVFTPISTVGSISTAVAALRVYLNNGGAVGTATNNSLFSETALAAQTVSPTNTTAINSVTVNVNQDLKASYKLYAGVSAITANSKWQVVVFANDY